MGAAAAATTDRRGAGRTTHPTSIPMKCVALGPSLHTGLRCGVGGGDGVGSL